MPIVFTFCIFWFWPYWRELQKNHNCNDCKSCQRNILKAKISANEDKRRILDAIQISSTIIALTSENLFCNDDLILSLQVENFSRKVPTGSLRPVCIVALIMFTATKLVGAKSNTFDFSNSEFLYENVFVRDWYNTLVKNEFCTLHCLLKIWRDQ